jgi:hypothetical protein
VTDSENNKKLLFFNFIQHEVVSIFFLNIKLKNLRTFCLKFQLLVVANKKACLFLKKKGKYVFPGLLPF